MAFSDFQYPDVLAKLGLTEGATDLFPQVPPVVPTHGFTDILGRNTQLAVSINTEKARSEYLIAPLLGEFWGRYGGRVGLHSGVEFAADPANGLNGFCDFLLGRGPQVPRVRAPVLVVFEAKNEKIAEGFGQCIAGMVGVDRFNRREGIPDGIVYGCITTGTEWRFLRLAGSTVTFDLSEYAITQVDRILGILVHIVGAIPEAVAA
jgi:hypothetical protein